MSEDGDDGTLVADLGNLCNTVDSPQAFTATSSFTSPDALALRAIDEIQTT